LFFFLVETELLVVHFFVQRGAIFLFVPRLHALSVISGHQEHIIQLILNSPIFPYLWLHGPCYLLHGAASPPYGYPHVLHFGGVEGPGTDDDVLERGWEIMGVVVVLFPAEPFV